MKFHYSFIARLRNAERASEDEYAARVAQLEAEGLSTSDAQAVADAEQAVADAEADMRGTK